MPSVVVIFNGSAQIDTAQFKCGASSLLLNEATSDFLSIADSPDWSIAASVGDDWTIHGFIKLDGHTGTDVLCGQRVGSTNKWLISNVHGSSFSFSWQVSATGITLTGTEITDSDFHHIAVCKVQDQWGLYIDGVQVAHDSEDTAIADFAAAFEIGTDSNVVFYKGWIDQFIITRKNVFSAAPVSGLTDTITVPTCPVTTGPGLANCSYVEDGQVRKMSTSVRGLDHLEGEAIEIQMDGILPTDSNGKLVTNSFTVASGAITLPKAAAVVHAGLPYDGTLQLLKQSGGSAIGTGQTKMRRTYNAVVRFFKSLGLKVGPDTDNLSPIFMDTPSLPLHTGDKRKLPVAPWDDETEMVFKMEDPLPCLILSILLESEVEEKG